MFFPYIWHLSLWGRLKFAYEAPNGTQPNQITSNWTVLALFLFSGKEAPNLVDFFELFLITGAPWKW